MFPRPIARLSSLLIIQMGSIAAVTSVLLIAVAFMANGREAAAKAFANIANTNPNSLSPSILPRSYMLRSDNS